MTRLASLISALPERTQLTLGESALRMFGAKRLVGAEAIGVYLSLTGAVDDVEYVLRNTRSLETWIGAWCERAEDHLAAANRAASVAMRIAHLRIACCEFAFANQGHALRDIYDSISGRIVAAHADIHELVTPHYETIDIPAGQDSSAAALLRVPEGSGPWPVVVTCQGLERVKEQGFHFEDACLARGLAVLAVDQPGVGETLARRVLLDSAGRLDAFAAGLGIAVEHDDRLDSGRVVIFGHSMGGATTLGMSAALGASATATLGSPLVLRIEEAPAMFRERARFAAGVETNAEFEALLGELDLASRVGDIAGDMLVVHGSADPVIPLSQSDAIVEAATVPVVHRVYPGGDHSCTQFASALWPQIADFFAESLASV